VGPQVYLEFYLAQKQSSNGYTHGYEVQLFNGVVSDITGSRIIPEIDMATSHTGSNTISRLMVMLTKPPNSWTPKTWA